MLISTGSGRCLQAVLAAATSVEVCCCCGRFRFCLVLSVCTGACLGAAAQGGLLQLSQLETAVTVGGLLAWV